LRWRDVDFDRKCLRLPDSKVGARVVPIAIAALNVLAGLPKAGPWVLPAIKGEGHYVGLQKHWKAVKLKAQSLAMNEIVTERSVSNEARLGSFRIHDLRHSFASFAVMDGAPLFLVGKLLGHKQTRTTEIYAHTADNPMRGAAEIAAKRIAEAMTPVREVVPPSRAKTAKDCVGRDAAED
jgi:integrase